MDQALRSRVEWAEKYLSIMDDIEYRRVESAEDLEEVGRLRALSYRTHNVMDRDGPIIDEIDFHSHAHVFAIYYRERLISTIRLHHLVGEHRHGTAYDIFSDVLDPLLDQGMTFIDPVRHASDPETMGELPMPYITLRLATMASKYFEVNYCLASIRQAHHAFYRRTFGATQIAEARAHEGICDPNSLFASNIALMYDRVVQRYPFFNSEPREREKLFAPAAALKSVPLTIRPTARRLFETELARTVAA
ncbi:N-acyl amino acid synthase FeeM domain-containing protein [Pararhizobium haloflavum]|uniref:N-acyl amino acid synthase FeeM domain-containing protein n=1 Tax=Pararhizobium haloflavum TaxID=2037914 RepID=UPI000C1762CC|nr:acetyltransferase [Pararhizobium haloflavum]